jgi:hypothetical protein
MAISRSLNPAEKTLVESGIADARRYEGAADAGPLLARVQQLYDDLLAMETPSAPLLETLGYGFGQALAEHGGLVWVMLCDDGFSDEPGLSLPDLELTCAPLSMMAGRIEDGEVADLARLAAETVATLRAHAGNAARRGTT